MHPDFISENNHASCKYYGAASGIGLALSRQFTEQGWNVTLADVDVLGGQRAAEELSDQTFFRKTDVSNWDDVASLYKKTVENLAGLTMLPPMLA